MKIGRIGLLALLGVCNLAPIAAAEPAGSFTIGVLDTAGFGDPAPAFIQALRELGYREGQNLTVVSRSPRDNNEGLPKVAAELASLKPDVLVGMGTPPALALKKATTSIAIVMLNVGNPIATGLIQSLAHPGGNVTGTSNAVEEWGAKRLQMVTEVLPGIRCLIWLMNPANPAAVANAPMLRKAGEKLGIEFHVMEAATPDQLDQALAVPLDDRCRAALFLPLDGLFVRRRAQIADFALRQRIALFSPFLEDAEAGALIAYGINADDQWRLGASYVDKILKGAKPADLPVQEPVKFEMVVNLKTAKALGIVIPPPILVQASEVIE
jgi:putative ABC transport system substrate-binding protein